MQEIDVVILAYTLDREVYDMNMEAINSLMASEPKLRFNIVLMESNKAWPKLGWSYPAQVRVIIPDEAFNFNRFNNLGMREGSAKWIVFANNDVRFHPGWCSAMLRVHAKNPQIRCLCPHDLESPFTPPGSFTGRTHQVGYLVRVEFTGWCFMLQRSVFAETGPFDESFDYYFADDDFTLALRRHSILNAVVRASKVNHLAHVTSRKSGVDISEKFREAQATFHRKWGSQRSLAWKARLVKYLLRPLGMKGIIRKIYRPK